MEVETGLGKPFVCGVLEGFYNRPWNQSQRVDLFKKLNAFGLNAYLYAPKDDAKHRSLWRDTYTELELRDLKVLIDGCHENDVTFYYGISPGLDMMYSNPADMCRLKAKLDQLVELGCKGFAVLWDDIDISLPIADQKSFTSLADAHVKVTNEVYGHIKGPKEFLTCPVEYCASRAEPNVSQSHYLNTMGTGLHENIGIFWTGPKVISEVITKDEIIQLERVLRRKPVIWDNLHANDYDQQRMFLGPYSGRSPELIPHLAGVFTNPNCEYSLNVPALFTLAAWSHCYDPRTGAIGDWNPATASDLAIPHFLEEAHRPTFVSSGGVGSNGPGSTTSAGGDASSVIQQPGRTPGRSSKFPPLGGELEKEDVELLFHLFWLPHSNGPKADCLVKSFKQLRDHAHIIQKLGLFKSATTSGDEMVDEDSDEADANMVDVEDESCHQRDPVGGNNNPPAERHLTSTWLRKASFFNEVCKRYGHLIDKMTFIENRELFFDINGYLSNLNVILQSCNRFLKWVGVERCHKPLQGGPTLAGLPGGVAGDLMRLFPVQSNEDYPLHSIRPNVDDSTLVCRPLPKKDLNRILPGAFLTLFCETHGILESDLPEDVIRVIQGYKVGAFISAEDSTDVTAVVVENGDHVLASIVGCQNAGGVVKSLQQFFDTAKTLDSLPHIPITLPTNDELLPWLSLSTYDVLISFAASPRLLFTKLLCNMLRLMFELTSGSVGSDDLTVTSRKYGIFVEKNATVSVQFFLEQGFSKVGVYNNFVIMEIEVTNSP